MFRSITSAGRAALRTGAFSRQVIAKNQQPSLFNALRAFSDEAAGRTKGTVKWFGTSVVSVSDMYSSRRCWFTARPRPSLSWQSCYDMVGLDLFISASVDEHFVYAELFLKFDPAASLALSHHSLIILSSIANTHRSQEGIRFHCSRRWKRRLLRSLLGGSHRRIQESRRRGGGGV